MKNILLIFLSDIKTYAKGDKVLISDSHYETPDGAEIHVTNESAVRYIRERGIALDKIFIFASEKIRKNITDRSGAVYLGEDGKPRTHLDYFIERLAKFLPSVDTEPYPYDESKTGSAYNLESVAKMAGRIQDFAQNGEVTLHVDLTGGMRHINMMMLDVTRLLEYSGIEIGRLIYSNYNFDTKICHVEEVRDIYDLFQLISGVEEFVQFGSVEALKKYYKGKTLSPALKKLVDAMENFAKEIKLCHYGRLEESIKNLHDAVHDFEASSDVQDLLMARLIERIRKDYKSLIEMRERDDLRVIRWCIENDYMQQALTLYVERIPEYLGASGFLTQSAEEAEILKDAVAKDTMHREPWFYLLNEVKLRREYSVDKGVAKFCDTLKKDALKAINKKNFNYDEWWANLSAVLEPLNIYCLDEPRLRRQLELLAELWKNLPLLFELSAPELDPIRAIIDKLLPEIGDLPKAYLRFKRIADFIFKMEGAEAKNYFPEFVFATDIEAVRGVIAKYPSALKFYRMIDEGIFDVAGISRERFFSIMDRYVRLKTERNDSNHAHAELNGEFETADNLKKCIAAGLKEIEEAKNLCIKSS